MTSNRPSGLLPAARQRLVRARDALFYAVPHRWRGRLAAALPSRLVPPEARPDFFDRLYEREHDPFGFDVNPEEQLKFRRTLEVCGEGRLGRVLELGCAVGTFTELIAPRADAVLGVDVSAAAIERARERLRNHPNVQLETREVADGIPPGPFDLVVASDVLYYLSVEELQECVRGIEAALAPGGALVAVHYVPRMGSILDGDEAHDTIGASTSLVHTFGERTEFGEGRPYRIDRFEKRDPASVS